MVVSRLLAVLLVAAATCWPASLAAEIAVDGTLPLGGDCPQVGAWDPATTTCRIDDYTIAAGDILRIRSAVVEVAGTLTNEGMLDNRGTLIVLGFLDSVNDLVNFWDGVLVNHGEFFSHFMYNFGPLVNASTGTIEFEFHLENNAPMTNLGRIEINGNYINIPEMTFENRGSLDVGPAGVFSNDGVLINAGQLDNSGLVQNNDVLVEHCTGSVTGNPIQGGPATYAQALTLGATLLEWCAIPGASGYDVARGDMAVLRASGGDFAAATEPCAGNDLAGLSLIDESRPGTGQGFWFAVRPTGVAGATYDSPFSSQSSSRDAGIGSSGAPCP